MTAPSDEEYQAAQEFQRRAEKETWERTDLDGLSHPELAQWQAEQKAGSRGAILADQQWRIRLLNRQLKFSLWLTLLACISGLAGVMLGYYLHTLDCPTSARSVTPKTPADQHAEQKTP